jgi:hypothetical protein
MCRWAGQCVPPLARWSWHRGSVRIKPRSFVYMCDLFFSWTMITMSCQDRLGTRTRRVVNKTQLSVFLAGEIVSSLLGVSGVRLYHDNALSRCPGSERTRWHCDDGPDAHMVMADSEVVTVWIPLQRCAKRCFSEPLF